MDNYPEYSKDIWDYLGDLHYMPSRQERDRLIERRDEKHLEIWDYFFRIHPEYIGMPQKTEVKKLRQEIDNKINLRDEAVGGINLKIRPLEEKLKKMRGKRVRNGVIAILLGFLGLLYDIFQSVSTKTLTSDMLCYIGPAFIIGLIFLAADPFSGLSEKQELGIHKNQIRDIEDAHDLLIEETAKRIAILENAINELIQQIPSHPSNRTVQKWLEEDIKNLETESLDSTGLGTRLVPIGLDIEVQAVQAPNPIPIIGPGELQDPNRIPQTFEPKISLNMFKHLHARRAAYVETELIVFYGVYYIEHIIVADDIIATCGRFFDFISGMSYSEHTTEQYYKDVVAIETTKEFRKISPENEDDRELVIENAPTFSLSLANGERRTVTFVNQDYFSSISKKLEIEENEIKHLKWATDAPQLANTAIKALRKHLRDYQELAMSKKDKSSNEIKITIGGNVIDSSFNVGNTSNVNTQYKVSTSNYTIQEIFINIHKQIESRPLDPKIDKEKIYEAVQKIEEEINKKEKANTSKLQQWLTNLAKMAPDIFSVIVASLTSPQLGIATAIRNVAEKAKQDAGK